MKCVDIEENLSVFFDGELDCAEKTEIEKHLEVCISCRKSFKNMRAVSGNLKRNATVSASPLLDEKLMDAFQKFHGEKTIQKSKQNKEKFGWFGIPRIAFAAAFLLFALGMIASFQIGRMSLGKVSNLMSETRENVAQPNETNVLEKDEKIQTVKIVEVPVVREKLVKVPVIEEKIVTKKIYVNQKNPAENADGDKRSVENIAASKANDKYLTPIELKGFQPIAKAKARITKKKEEDENYEN